MFLYFLFAVYFLVCIYFLPKIKFVQNTDLGTKMILLLFSIKITAGIIGGLVSHFLMHDKSDLFLYTTQGLVEYDNLIHNPKLFFTDSLPSVYENGIGNFFVTQNSFWNDLRNNILIKTIGVFNILSRGNYYINSLFFNTIAFMGNIALYRVFKTIYVKQNWAVIIGSFLLPSTLYFDSLIGKDLVLFTALSFYCYSLFFSLENKFTLKYILVFILSFFSILFFRNFVLVILLPCTVAWVINKKYKIKLLNVYGLVFIVAIIVIIITQFLPHKYNLLELVVKRQQDFFSLGKANSQYQNDTLTPTIKSFITATPNALRHSFLSPFINEFNNKYLNLFALEMWGYFLLFLLMFIYPIKEKKGLNSFTLFGIIFCLLILLFAGYITPNAGSLIRYRSIYLPFLIIPILCNINWNFIKIKNTTYKS